MKMSDEFKKGVSGVGISENDCGIDEYRLEANDDNGGFYATFSHKPHAQAAAHAINCHDELVEALELCIGVIDLYGVKFGLDLSGDPSEGRKKVGAILAKAKG